MKRIIKPTSSYVTKCPYCDLEFSYDRGDIKTYKRDGYVRMVVICPGCTNRLLHKDRMGTNTSIMHG